MFSVHFLSAGDNFCAQSQNLGSCRGPAVHYSLGRFDIPKDLQNPNGADPDENLRFTVVYFKYGYNHNLNSTRSPTYKVKFDNNDSQKWSCTCPDFISRRLAQQTCCKHIQGCIDIRQVDLLYPNLPVAIRFTPNYIKILRNHITRQ